MLCEHCKIKPGAFPYKTHQLCLDCHKLIKKKDSQNHKKAKQYLCIRRGCNNVTTETAYCQPCNEHRRALRQG